MESINLMIEEGYSYLSNHAVDDVLAVCRRGREIIKILPLLDNFSYEVALCEFHILSMLACMTDDGNTRYVQAILHFRNAYNTNPTKAKSLLEKRVSF